MEFLDSVNENDEITGRASKKEIYEKQLLHRIVHVLVFNDKGEMALQLRSKCTSFCPLHWCTSAGGHAQSGESYEKAALRELKEEIGTMAKIDFAHKDLYTVTGNFRKFLATFRTVFNGSFKINPVEVEKVEFFSLDKIQKMIKDREKFHPELLFLLRKHFNMK
ncbi:MAG: NUDIX domain-containing protein [Candidatus Woesearchaeota archaeon]|nr:NUDIX domain-containing protein [Candidatus Woesearchaeota archaeon]